MNTCVVSDRKKNITVKAERMAIYMQSTIVEASADNRQSYYLIFYKNDFLIAIKAASVNRRSFLEKAFKKGMRFSGNHPLMENLLSSSPVYMVKSLPSFMEKLPSRYSSYEAAYIFTFFDAFLTKKHIFKEIQSIYFQYRRNGQLFGSYRMIQLLKQYVPKHSWLKQLMADASFDRFSELYTQQPSLLLTDDPLYAERMMFKKRSDGDNASALQQIYSKENRIVELMALLITEMKRRPSMKVYREITERLPVYFSDTQRLKIFENLYKQSPQFSALQEDLIHSYLNGDHPEKAVSLMTSARTSLTAEQLEKIAVSLKHSQFDKDKHILSHANKVIIQLFDAHPEHAEDLLKKCIISMLQHYDFKYIFDWMAPIQKASPNSPIFAQVMKMEGLANDPEKQLQLGELYYAFKQFDLAIECFSWEMELKSSDPKPVLWLSKAYYEKGMEQESKAYREMYRTMQQA
ncbi:hypothetical protein [Alteribacillus sp. HJP-4]|uniref:hypothetical protein n=1 Tax=Alteribacillus sp. HJP-4 TaxID=2775394 RepID=UPI0035CCD504